MLKEKYIGQKKEMIPITDGENRSYENEKHCHVCRRDHCHFTGKYSGAAHSKCNMNYKITKYSNCFS